MVQVSADTCYSLHKRELRHETLGECKGISAMVTTFHFSLASDLFKLPRFPPPLRYALRISRNNCLWPSECKKIITILMSVKYLHWL